MTRTDSTTGVSRLVRRPSSCSTFAMTPEDETQVTPASATAAIGPQPSRKRDDRPGRGVERHVDDARESRCLERCRTSSTALYSRPSITISRMTPISAPISMNSSLAAIGKNPPSPKARPPSRMSGIGRDADARGESSEQADPQEERADLDEDERVVSHRAAQPPAMMRTSLSSPSRVPRATRLSPVVRRSVGTGAGSTPVSRMIATTEQRVRVRALVSPRVRPT